ncbi:MAG: hypothetical protein ACM31C_22620 [Acidobacteriota bacterium]
MTFDDVETFASALPGVTAGARHRHRTWFVGDHGFAWQRAFSKADLKRFGDETPPAGEILAVMVENLDAKEALLAMGLPGFFTISHFQGYPAILIALAQARAKDVRAAIRDAHRIAAAKQAPRKRVSRAARGRARR